MKVFTFIDAEKANFPVTFMCSRLGVSKSGYYAWRDRPLSARAVADAELTERITTIHAESRGTYGAPRVHAELRLDHGVRCGRKRIARLMRAAGLEGVHRRRRQGLTRRDPAGEVSDDLVERNFRPAGPDRLWVADITEQSGERDGTTTDEREELRHLRSDVKTLRMERDLLKKAAAFFARDSDPTR